MRASDVVILANLAAANNNSSDVAASMAVTNEAIVDSDAIFTYQVIRCVLR